jgi:hypothetical protein
MQRSRRDQALAEVIDPAGRLAELQAAVSAVSNGYVRLPRDRKDWYD